MMSTKTNFSIIQNLKGETVADKTLKIVVTAGGVRVPQADGEVKIFKKGDVLELAYGAAKELIGSGRCEEYKGSAKAGESVEKKK
jgi:hypothetical protein